MKWVALVERAISFLNPYPARKAFQQLSKAQAGEGMG